MTVVICTELSEVTLQLPENCVLPCLFFSFLFSFLFLFNREYESQGLPQIPIKMHIPFLLDV